MTLWQTLTAADGDEGDFFGSSLALSGTNLVVGASDDEGPNNQPERGSVYVFTLSGSTWVQKQKLLASDGQSQGHFGASVAISLSTLIIGASGGVGNGTSANGAAYVFVLSNSNWSQQQKLTVSDSTPSDYFGLQVTISGNSLAVMKGNYPAVYTFQQAGGWWYYQQKLAPLTSIQYGTFGQDVTIQGTTMVMNDNPQTGVTNERILVYELVGTSWQLQQTFTTPRRFWEWIWSEARA